MDLRQETARVRYKFKRRPYKHQAKALKKLCQNKFHTEGISHSGGGALLMEPRTGKTKVCIDYASILHQAGRISRVLIVCPVSVMGVWEEEISKDCPFPHQVVVWDKDGRKHSQLPKWGKDRLDFVIVNYEAFASSGRRLPSGRQSKKTGRWAVRRKLELWDYQLMILDESHRIKTPSARRTTMLVRMGRTAPYRVIATGTPVTKAKRVVDVYAQWKFLNPESPLVKDMDFASFKAAYGQWRRIEGRHGGSFEKFIRNRNSKRLHRLIHEDAYAVTRAECFDLPPSVSQVIPVTLEESRQAYVEMAETMIARLHSGEITEASLRIVQSLRLHQLTSGIAKTEPSDQYPSGRLVRIGREKLRALQDQLTDLFEAGEKVVIAARFRADLASIQKLVASFKVKKYTLVGGMSRRERDSAWRNFQSCYGPAAFIMQPNTGGLGIDLSTASTMIWYSLTNSWVDYTQANDRIALSRKSTTFLYLVVRGSVDEIIMETLKEDGDVAKEILKRPERLLELR